MELLLPTGTKSLGLAVTEEGDLLPTAFSQQVSEYHRRKVFRHLEEGGARAPMLSVLLVPMGPATHTVPLLGRPPPVRGPWKNTKNGGQAERPRRGVRGEGVRGKLP